MGEEYHDNSRLGLTITLRDVWLATKEAGAKTTALEAKLDAFIAAHSATKVAQDAMTVELRERLKQAENDVSELQRQPIVTPRSMWTGLSIVAGVVTGVVTVVASIVSVVVRG